MIYPTSPSNDNPHENYDFLLPLFDYFSSFHPISSALKADYIANCQPLHIKKTKFILSPLDQNSAIYFLTKGLVRGFIRENDKDITTWFSTGNEVIGAIKHPLGHENHSEEYLQALEDCDLIVIPYAFIESVYEKHPEGHIIGRKLFALKYHAAAERAILARYPRAIDRYNKMLDSGQVDLNRIPLKYIGSYLGIRIETLSRIRAKKS